MEEGVLSLGSILVSDRTSWEREVKKELSAKAEHWGLEGKEGNNTDSME